MKIILKKDVEKLGKKGDVCKVSDGFARNFLLPQKMAEVATDGLIKEYEKRKIVAKKKTAQKQQELLKKAKNIEGLQITLKKPTDDTGKLYGSISTKEILSELKKIKTINDINLEEKMIIVEQIKNLGDYSAKLKLTPELVVSFKLKIANQQK